MSWLQRFRQLPASVWLIALVAVVPTAAHPSGFGGGAAVPAAGVTGACCFIDQSCFELTETECQSLPGAALYHGDDTVCSEVVCEEVVGLGACCVPFGECVCCTSEAFCVAHDGVFHEGVLCEDIPAPCTERGACCLPDGSCDVTEMAACQAAGGQFTFGVGSTCNGVQCRGACCVDHLECSRVTEQECATLGGDYYGDATVCIFEPCVTNGACCLPDGTCQETTQTQCVAELGGAYFVGIECPATSSNVLIGNTTSMDLEGDELNVKLLVDVAAEAGIPGSPIDLNGVSWNVSIQAICQSWLADARIGIGDDFGDNTVVLAPGAGDNLCGTMSYAGSQSIDLHLSDGVAVLEFFESYDDRPNLPDALYLPGSTLTLEFGGSCTPPRVLNTTKATVHPTIQAAIDAADPTDELMVAPGVYKELIDFSGKPVTVQGLTGDPADVVIDGGGTVGGESVGPVVTMGPGSDGTLRAVTVTGAIVGEADGSLPGTGVLVHGCTPLIDNCVIFGNEGVNGGGVRVGAGSGPMIYRTRFVDNFAYQRGGGLHLDDGATAWVVSSVFEFNQAPRGGAVFAGNGADATIKRTIMRVNFATLDGSAVECDGCEVSLASCLVQANSGYDVTDASLGAALDNRAGEMLVRNCTIVHNVSPVIGGLHADDGLTLIVNSIIRGNDPLQQVLINGGLTEISHSNIQGGEYGPYSIDADPMFVDPPNDYRLKAGSPCVNTGDMDDPEVCPPECIAVLTYPLIACLDLDEQTRLRECRVDMGAYESSHYNDCNANGVSDACDVSPVYGFLCTETLDLGQLPGDSTAYKPNPSEMTIVGNNDGASGASVAWKGTELPIAEGTLDFFVEYESEDSDCGASGSWDYPVFFVNGLFFGLNHDGTLTDALAMNCESAGTIDNGDPGARSFRVWLEDLAGTGPYQVGIGVVSVDNTGGAGTVTFSELFALDDVNYNGVPDECDCPHDLDDDLVAGFADILEIILNWGPCPPGAWCRHDISGNGTVDFADIFEIILNWGPCLAVP